MDGAKALSIGSVIGRSFSLLTKQPALFIGLVAITLIPVVLMVVGLPGGLVTVLLIVQIVLSLVVQACIAYAVFQILRGNTPGISDSFSHGFSRVGPLIVTSLLVSLGAGLGALLLVVPGIILMVMWAVAVPVCVVEKLGPIDSMKRSADLSKDYRWTIFGLVLAGLLLTAAVSGVVELILAMIFGQGSAIGIIVSGALALIPQALYTIIIAVIYFDLRSVKEGINLEALANVFD